MRVAVLTSSAGAVVLESPLGQIAGVWRDQTSPSPGQVFDVEFTVDWVIRGADIVNDAKPTPSCRCDGTLDEIVGLIEDVDPDGMGYLRLGPDSLTMFETDGSVVRGHWVRLCIPRSSVEIYPYDRFD